MLHQLLGLDCSGSGCVDALQLIAKVQHFAGHRINSLVQLMEQLHGSFVSLLQLVDVESVPSLLFLEGSLHLLAFLLLTLLQHLQVLDSLQEGLVHQEWVEGALHAVLWHGIVDRAPGESLDKLLGIEGLLKYILKIPKIS